MNRKIVIKSCNNCPNRSHSGNFTMGGAYPLCMARERPSNVRPEPDYRGPMRVLPFKIEDDGRGRACRSYTGEIPEWCPLPGDSSE